MGVQLQVQIEVGFSSESSGASVDNGVITCLIKSSRARSNAGSVFERYQEREL